MTLKINLNPIEKTTQDNVYKDINASGLDSTFSLSFGFERFSARYQYCSQFVRFLH